MTNGPPFLQLIRDIIEANRWEEELIAEKAPPPGPPGWTPGQEIVQIRATDSTIPPDPSDVVGLYVDGHAFPEQIQDECLRFLRARNIRDNIRKA